MVWFSEGILELLTPKVTQCLYIVASLLFTRRMGFQLFSQVSFLSFFTHKDLLKLTICQAL